LHKSTVQNGAGGALFVVSNKNSSNREVGVSLSGKALLTSTSDALGSVLRTTEGKKRNLKHWCLVYVGHCGDLNRAY
jgi:hypothetical protein